MFLIFFLNLLLVFKKEYNLSEFLIFMMSDKSKYFNGEDINIDGGWLSS